MVEIAWGAEQEIPEDVGHSAAGVEALFVGGGDFILDAPATPEALWGSCDEVLWAEGEAVIIAARQGLGKTTLAQQLALGRCGFHEYSTLLGFPIAPGDRRTLYLAMDRPRQAARSFRRMVGEAWRAELNDRLLVWQGPPPFDLARHTGLLAQMAERADADTVIVDSLKDAAVGISDDEVGAGYNRARQTAIAAGVQVVELHHQRKQGTGQKKARPDIDDLYGSTWVPSGAGSVLLLTGDPGDPIVGLHHVKQPASEVGPFRVIHDHDAGRSEVWLDSLDVLALAKRAEGVTALELAAAMGETTPEKVTRNDKEKARRKLARMEKAGSLVVLDDGDQRANKPRRWGAP